MASIEMKVHFSFDVHSVEDKAWGTTEPLLVLPTIEIHRIKVKPHSWCSVHKHVSKWNAFVVVEGELHVQLVQKNVRENYHLKKADFLNVAPEVVHQFRTFDEPCVAYEIYFPKALGKEDIVRFIQGGSVS